MLEDMLQMYVMEEQTRWEEYLYLVKFSYKNGHHSSIGMDPFQVLYGHSCQTPLSWDQLEDKVHLGLDMLQDMGERVVRIRAFSGDVESTKEVHQRA